MSTEARIEFGLSSDMMTKLLRNGTLPYTTDPIDKRIKWVQRAHIAAIAAASERLNRRRHTAPKPGVENASQDAAHAAPAAAADTPSVATPATVPEPPAGVASGLASRQRRPGQLKPSDRVVLNYLRALCAVTGTDCTPPVGYQTIAGRCGICPRQAQICCDRLVAVRRIERVGHDSGHRDLTRRGMVYRITGAAWDTPDTALHAEIM